MIYFGVTVPLVPGFEYFIHLIQHTLYILIFPSSNKTTIATIGIFLIIFIKIEL